MKEKRIFGFAFIMVLVGFSFININFPKAKNQTYQVGEKLRYRVTYGFVDAGEAILEVKATNKKPQNRDLVHVVATGRTLGAFNGVYKVNDVYESYIDRKGAFPWEFVRDVNEGGYIIKQKYTFNQHKLQVNNGEKNFNVPIGIQDMISSFYYARTLDFKNMKEGQITSFKCFMDDEIYDLKIKYVGEKDITIRKGKFKCMKFVPVVQTGRYFKHEDDVEFYVTADDNKIPIYVKAKIPFGTVKLQLVEWENLKSPISKIK